MIPFSVTALTRATFFIQRKAKTREIFSMKTFQKITQSSFIVSIFNQTSNSFSERYSSTTALRNFKKARAEMNSQFTFDEHQEMETQPIHLSSDESEITSSCSTPIQQLSNNIPDTYCAITQILAAQHEQRSS